MPVPEPLAGTFKGMVKPALTLPECLFCSSLFYDLPEASHQKREFAKVPVIVIGPLVSHTCNHHDMGAIKDGDVHVPDDRDMPLWISLLLGVRGCIVIGDHRAALPDRLPP